MDKNGTQKPVFDIPDQSLATTEVVDSGSAAWMKKITKEHGDTSPQKLEKRREKISVYAQIIEDAVKNLQIQKKLYLARNQKLINEKTAALKEAKKDSEPYIALSAYIDALQTERQQQEQNFQLLIQQSITNSAMVEGLCLIVDSLTLREPVKSKSGKIGMLRFSGALYMCDAAYYATKLYNRTKKMHDIMVSQNPALAAVLEDDEGEEDAEYEDDDVVNEDDRKQIRKDLDEGVEM